MSKVAIVMGSDSDRAIVERAIPYLEYFGIKFTIRTLSAHRNASELDGYLREMEDDDCRVIIAAAGMANHLAGSLAARTALPVIGLPLPGGMMDGLDSLLSTVQMPGGVPVATVSVGKAGAVNAAVLAARIIALSNEKVGKRLQDFANAGFKLS